MNLEKERLSELDNKVEDTDPMNKQWGYIGSCWRMENHSFWVCSHWYVFHTPGNDPNPFTYGHDCLY